jgi:hypothetical protein
MGNLSLRVWLFRFLVLVASGLMVVSWILPWWRGDLSLVGAYVQIRPWGLETDLGAYATYIDSAFMPVWFAPVMWTYLGLCIAALLFSMFAKNKEIRIWKIKSTLPGFIIGLVGFSYIAIVITAVIFAAIRSGDFYGTHLIGKTGVDFKTEHFSVNANLLIGYWLACGTGTLLAILALLRHKITGQD